jgi:hypothetical protein
VVRTPGSTTDAAYVHEARRSCSAYLLLSNAAEWTYGARDLQAVEVINSEIEARSGGNASPKYLGGY